MKCLTKSKWRVEFFNFKYINCKYLFIKKKQKNMCVNKYDEYFLFIDFSPYIFLVVMNRQLLKKNKA